MINVLGELLVRAPITVEFSSVLMDKSAPVEAQKRKKNITS